LENDGTDSSAGSHFERAIFFEEIMNSGEMKDEVFSNFTFLLLKDSGWYGYDEYYAENFETGKNMGCDWFNNCHSQQNKQYFCDRLN